MLDEVRTLGLTSQSTMPSPPPFTLVEPEDKYHARSSRGECMSSGMLKLFRQCPYTYHLTVTGAMAGNDTAAYRLGRAVHKLVLEGEEAFARSFTVGGPVNEKTGKCFGVGTKAYDAWLAENGIAPGQVVSIEEMAVIRAITHRVRNHCHAAAYLEYGWPELVVRAELHAGVLCQIRMDWLTHDKDGNYAIVDLKTTHDLDWFQKDAAINGYFHQFALYRDVFQAVGFPVRFVAIAVEKKGAVPGWCVLDSKGDARPVQRRKPAVFGELRPLPQAPRIPDRL